MIWHACGKYTFCSTVTSAVSTEQQLNCADLVQIGPVVISVFPTASFFLLFLTVAAQPDTFHTLSTGINTGLSVSPRLLFFYSIFFNEISQHYIHLFHSRYTCPTYLLRVLLFDHSTTLTKGTTLTATPQCLPLFLLVLTQEPHNTLLPQQFHPPFAFILPSSHLDMIIFTPITPKTKLLCLSMISFLLTILCLWWLGVLCQFLVSAFTIRSCFHL